MSRQPVDPETGDPGARGALGVTLFERARRSVAPTAIGLEIAEQARTILKETEDLVEAALASRDPLSGPLQLGAIPTIRSFLLPSVLLRLLEETPRLRIYLREEQTAPLLGRLEAGQIDAAIVALPISLKNVETALDRFFRRLLAYASSWRGSRQCVRATWRPRTRCC